MSEKKIESELDEREPELDESSDYDKPLSSNKRTWIMIAFGIAVGVYILYTFLMTAI